MVLAERGITVEATEDEVTVTTIDGVRITGPELVFEMPKGAA